MTSSHGDSVPKNHIGAVELASLLGMPHAPTPEQVRVIEAPLRPALVVAGAGSGKTETMAARVVWLIANGHVAAHEVLGLTFTRKAATSLMSRIRSRISMLADHGLLSGDSDDDANVATVSTYNSFAHRIYSQYAIHIGLDPDATIISEATAWQLARHVVRTTADDDIGSLDVKINELTSGLLDLSRAMNDHVAQPDDVHAFGIKMSHKLHDLVDTYSDARKTSRENFDSCMSYATSLPVLVRLTQEYDRAKRERGFIEFSDQVRFALEICERSPAVVDDLRAQFRIVLLDEYQDTSVLQTKLLTRVFRDTPVMAVGDPHQSIYGWRGASATNMAKFSDDFGVPHGQQPFPLPVSWRNPVDVLRAANTYVEPLIESSPIPVSPLQPRPNAPRGPISVEYFETIADETETVAQWFAQRLATGDNVKTAALLFRATRPMAAFRAALENANIPCHVVGLGGLLDEPVIVDLVCALSVIHDVSADSQLVRLLSGPRWMIAPRDLVGLRKIARWLANHDHRRKLLDAPIQQALRQSVANEDAESLIDAVDFIASTSTDYEVFSNVSPQGLLRLRDAGRFISRLRQHATFDLRDLITHVFQELRLDLEVAANPDARPAHSAFDAFLEPLSNFVNSTDQPTLGSFLGWLKEAERRERLSPASPPAEAGVVQLMTIHAAKGLEWDLVAIPRLVDKELPGDRTRAETWRKFGALPYVFRGDADDLPEWAWESATDVNDLCDSFESFRAGVRLRFDSEERRLMYVGTTRARDDLLLTGSYWNTQKTPRRPSIFLNEIIEAGIVRGNVPEIESPTENPLGDNVLRIAWPLDPLGSRRAAVESAAAAVRDARSTEPTPWDDDIDLLLAERELSSAEIFVPAPHRIAASRFKDFISQPVELAAQLRRPMPQQPYRATLLGTVFHEWVERRAGTASVLPGDLLDAIEATDDEDLAQSGPVDQALLRKLQETFAASEWGSLQPIDVEREIHIMLDGVSVVCKIDAVYRRTMPDGSQRIEIVDWKTGLPPANQEDYELKQTQLALYRVAYARWARIDVSEIDVAFYFVADNVVLRPESVITEDELVSRWRAAFHPHREAQRQMPPVD